MYKVCWLTDTSTVMAETMATPSYEIYPTFYMYQSIEQLYRHNTHPSFKVIKISESEARCQTEETL